MTDGRPGCTRLSHLAFRLHTAPDHKQKFMLLTQIFNFKEELERSEVGGAHAQELALRVLTALDPEFLYLIMRSSTIFQIIALEAANTLMTGKDTCHQMRKIVAYARNILHENAKASSFKPDKSTRAIAARIDHTGLVWTRLVHQALAALSRVATHLGHYYVVSYKPHVPELKESLEYLLSDMFDVFLNLGEPAGAERYIVDPKQDVADAGCPLCEMLDKEDFKGEAAKLEELYRDLEALANAHVEELNLADAESCGKAEPADIQNTLDKVTDSLLAELRAREENANATLSCLELVLACLPPEQRPRFVTRCLKSHSVDVLMMLIHLMSSGTTQDGTKLSLDFEAHNTLYTHCVKLLDAHMPREIALKALDFVRAVIERNLRNPTVEDYKDLLKVVRRCQVEIHVALDEALRDEHATASAVPFETMELVMSTIAEQENVVLNGVGHTHTQAVFFSTFHATVELLFEYFGNLNEKFGRGAPEPGSAPDAYRALAVRLMCCWMTLEPTKFRSKYLENLRDIVRLASGEEAVLLLPTFASIDAVDLVTTRGVTELLLGFIDARAGLDPQNKRDANTMRMTFNLIRRIHTDPMVEYGPLAASFDAAKYSHDVEWPELRDAELARHLDTAATFRPALPAGLVVPLPLALDAKTEGAYKALSAVVLNAFFKVARQAKLPLLASMLAGTYSTEEFAESLKPKGEFSEETDLLFHATLAAAATCMGRLPEADFLARFNATAMMLIMVGAAHAQHLVVFFFFQTAPRFASNYVEEDHRINCYYAVAGTALLLLRNYPSFISLLNHSLAAMSLKIPYPPYGQIDMVEEGFMTPEELALAKFFARYSAQFTPNLPTIHPRPSQ